MEMTRNLRAACKIEVASFKFPTHAEFRNLLWQRFDKIFVQAYACAKKAKNGHRHYWLCFCDCGGFAVVEATSLASGRSRSCGCKQSAVTIDRNLAMATHGESRRTIEYGAWTAMKARCNNPKYPKYHLYGGRGIRVCDRWANSYEAFLSDMGRRPADKTSLDRINGEKGYDPGNCRWADDFEQNRNRRFDR